MRRIFYVIAFLALVGCTKKEDPVYWAFLDIQKEESNVTVLFNYPYRFGGDTTVSNLMNTQIANDIKYTLTDNQPSISIDSTITLLIEQKAADTIISHIPYDLRIESSVYVDSLITSVFIKKIYYTGGANSNINALFLNMNNKTGALMPISSLIDTDSLLPIVREKFYKLRNIAPGASKEEVMMFCKPDQLPLPQAIGFDSLGVVAYYNLYDVFPRSFGPTVINIPYSEIKGILKR